MISLNKFMAEVKNKLKRLEDKKYIKDTLSLSGTWTAPYDGIVTCSGRATAAGAYLFCKDLTDNEYVGLCTIANNQQYGSVCFAVIKGRSYSFLHSNWGEQRNVYIHQN